MSKVVIINPVPGGSAFTTRSAAERHVRQGCAVMDRGRLQFLPACERPHARMERRSFDPITELGMARLNQVEGLPCAGPAIRVFTILSKRGRGYRATEVVTACDIPVRA